jgi:hypothetical protein
MKKAVIILSAIALLGCNQATKKQMTTANIDSLENTALEKHKELFDNDLCKIIEIDSLTFFSQRKKNIEVALDTITDIETVKKILKNAVKWGTCNEEIYEWMEDENGDIIIGITAKNGKYFDFSANIDGMAFIAYFPQEDILLTEGGHTSDWSVNMTTGEETEDVGNPYYFVYSPSKKYRLNGSFGGQECSSYFIQQYIGGKYIRIIQLFDYENNTVPSICTSHNEYWLDDNNLFVSDGYWYDEGIFVYNKFYQIILK